MQAMYPTFAQGEFWRSVKKIRQIRDGIMASIDVARTPLSLLKKSSVIRSHYTGDMRKLDKMGEPSPRKRLCRLSTRIRE